MYVFVLPFGVINDDDMLQAVVSSASGRVNILLYYTVSHKKRATLFLIITLAFLGRFFIVFAPVERGRNTLHMSLKNLPLHPNCVCVSTLPGKTKTTFWSQSSQCVWSVSNLRRNLSNVLLFQFLVENSFISLLWEKFSHFHKFLTIFFRSIFKLNVFNLMKYNCMKQTFMTCDVMQLWRHQVIK